MKIPYTINKNTLEAYKPSAQTKELLSEQLRKVIAENFEWDKDQCPSLEEFCISTIAKYFQEKPLIDELPGHDWVLLLDELALDLPLEFAIPVIFDEYYWEKRFKKVFRFCWRKKLPNWTWKGIYLERHCQKLIEEGEPQYNDEESFGEILDLCNPYVTRLYIEQLQTWKPPLTMAREDIPEVWPIEHLNMIPIFKKLQNIQELDITFGMKNVGEDFTWDMFEVSHADVQKLSKAILELQSLKILRIHRSNLDFKHCQILIRTLVKCFTVEVLDLSHCQIGDTGAMCIGYLLKEGTNLKVLNLTDNKIGKIGAEALGFGILQGKCGYLNDLNLRLNPLKTEGAMGIMRCLVRSGTPKRISMAACMFEEDTPLKVCQMLKLNDTLKKLDISSNYFGEECGDYLVEAVSLNTCIEWIDCREIDINQSQKEQIDEFLLRNRKAAQLEAKINRLENDEAEIEVEENNFEFPLSI
ncbi:dynein regulatory complex subunit 5-like [Anthonomus grandis grandis]|uniref:dynein regulatory complex subunit 5-like n=1 Tax=Anthonomus grandis grandis TaxID=2921223 RepID=UPI002165964A|nr:dynein regulatory complex subunit 5-like [Anthonomus grandis grandis]